MKITSFALGGTVLLSVAGLSAPALAFTHHPSTAAERKQTDDLNAQQLALARGQQPMQQQASVATPEQQDNAMTTAPQANPATGDQTKDNNAAQPSAQQNPESGGSSPQH